MSKILWCIQWLHAWLIDRSMVKSRKDASLGWMCTLERKFLLFSPHNIFEGVYIYTCSNALCMWESESTCMHYRNGDLPVHMDGCYFLYLNILFSIYSVSNFFVWWNDMILGWCTGIPVCNLYNFTVKMIWYDRTCYALFMIRFFWHLLSTGPCRRESGHLQKEQLRSWPRRDGCYWSW